MLATRRVNQPIPAPRRFSPRTPSRGGRGRQGDGAHFHSRKHSSNEAELDKGADLDDTATSPLKPVDNNTASELDPSGLAKKLNFVDEKAAADSEAELPGGGSSPSLVPPLPPAYVKARDRTKLQKTDATETTMATSAAAFEEDRRPQ